MEYRSPLKKNNVFDPFGQNGIRFFNKVEYHLLVFDPSNNKGGVLWISHDGSFGPGGRAAYKPAGD